VIFGQVVEKSGTRKLETKSSTKILTDGEK
jgi:hypothetical protein